MENGANTAELSAEEAAYFESGGETELKPATEQIEQEGQQNGVQTETGQAQTEEVTQDGQARDDKTGRFVPHQALHAEREEHKKTKAELEEIRRNQAVLNDRWNTLLQLRQETEKPQEETPPDPEQDIFGYAKWQAKQLEQLQTKIADQEKQTEQQRQIETQEREIWNSWSQSAEAYAAQKPEFGDAIKWLSEFRGKQLSSMAAIDERFATPQGVHEQINAELRAIVLGAKQKGINPAEVVHQMATAYGFQAKAPDPANITLPEQLAKVANAQEAAKTVGAAPGRTGADALTPEAIAAMSPQEFDRWASDPKNSALLDKMLGA